MHQSMKQFRNSEIAIVVMTSDRFWCQGLKCVRQTGQHADVDIHYCNSLTTLKNVLKEQQNICAVLTEEYGDNENMFDWLIFCSWICINYPVLKMKILCRADKGDRDMSLRTWRHGFVSMSSPVSVMHSILESIACGRFQGIEAPQHGADLTPRELYILKCLCWEEKPVTLGKRLGINVKTISTHKSTALRKLGLKRLTPLLGHHDDIHLFLENTFSEPECENKSKK